MRSHAACAGHVCIKLRTTGGASTRDSFNSQGSGEPNCTNGAVARAHLHKGIVDRNDKNPSSILEFGGVDVSRDMVLAASWRVRRWNS
jgi:hypothetical protein